MTRFSTRTIGLVALFLSVLARPAQAQPEANDEEYVRVPVNLSVVPGLSVGESIADGRKIINHVAINLLAGRAARLHGIEFGGIWNAYTENVRGVQLGGTVNTVGDTVRGAQLASVLNLAGGSVHGGQFSGVANVADGRARTQFGGVVSVAGRRTNAQFSGVASVTGGSVEGVQSGGVASIAGGRVNGVQIGGVVNVAEAPVRGAQIAGVVNIAPRVERGVQIGVVNVAREHGGVPIGLVSYVNETGLRYDVWGDEAGMVTAGVRSGNRRVANYLGVGVRSGGDTFHWGLATGLGVDFQMTERLHGTLDLLNYGLLIDDWDWEAWHNLSKVRLLGRFNLSPHVAIFGGPTFNIFVSDDVDGSDLVPWSVYDTETDGTHVRLGPGVTLGLRVATRAM